MSELIDRERFSADMRDFQNRVGIWRDEAEDTETWTRADAALATIIETKLILDKQPTIAAPRWVRCEEPPKEHMWCFVYTDEPDMIMPIRIAFYTASCTGKGSWYHYESGSDITDEVDYWTEMHLEGPKLDHDLPWPIEPPKEDKNGN